MPFNLMILYISGIVYFIMADRPKIRVTPPHIRLTPRETRPSQIKLTPRNPGIKITGFRSVDTPAFVSHLAIVAASLNGEEGGQLAVSVLPADKGIRYHLTGLDTVSSSLDTILGRAEYELDVTRALMVATKPPCMPQSDGGFETIVVQPTE